MEYKIDILDFDGNLEIIKTEEKSLYNTDNSLSASDWVKKNLKGKKITRPNLSSSLKVSEKNKTVHEGYYGVMNNNSNQIYKSGTEVFISSEPTSLNANVSILKENFYSVITLFFVRKSIKMTWINEKDEYIAPNEEHEHFEQFKYDSLVYSLFNSGSSTILTTSD